MKRAIAILVLLAAVSGCKGPDEGEDWVESAWKCAMTRFYVPKINGFIDYRTGEGDEGLLGGLPTPEEIAGCVPCVTGWCTGMEDGMLNAGPFLVAAMKRWEKTGSQEAFEDGHKIFKGMVRNGEHSGIPGFVIRTISPRDGKSFYPNSSRDQYTLFVYAMWRAAKCAMFSAEEQATAKRLIREVAEYAEKSVTKANRYRMLSADGKPSIVSQMWMEHPGVITTPGDENSEWKSDRYDGMCAHEMLRLPMFYAAAWDVTGDQHWRDMELKYVDDGLKMALAGIWKGAAFAAFQAQISQVLLYELEPDAARKTEIMKALQRFGAMATKQAEKSERLYGLVNGNLYMYGTDWHKLPTHKAENGKPAPYWERDYGRSYDCMREAAESMLNALLVPGGSVPERVRKNYEKVYSNLDYGRVNQVNGVVHALMAYWLDK